jgi:hypothetical protein
MTIEEYIIATARTEPPASHPDRLMHAAAGMLTELEDLARAGSRADIIDKIGNVAWHAAIIVRLTDATSFDTLPGHDEGTLQTRSHWVTLVAQIADQARKFKFYGKVPDWAIVGVCVKQIVATLKIRALDAKTNFVTALGANIAKWETKTGVLTGEESGATPAERALADAAAPVAPTPSINLPTAPSTATAGINKPPTPAKVATVNVTAKPSDLRIGARATPIGKPKL